MRRAELPTAGVRPATASYRTQYTCGRRFCAGELSPRTGEDDSALEQEGLGEVDPFSDVLERANEESVVDMDDANATDLDIGVLLQDIEEAPREPDAYDSVVDISDLLNTIDERSSADAGDEQGPVVPEAFYGFQDLPPDGDPNASDGLVDSGTDLSEQDLPALDGDADDDGVGLLDTTSFGDPERDEELPEWSMDRWHARAVEPALPPCNAVVLTGEWVVAGGSEVWWLDHGCSVRHRTGDLGASVVALAAIDAAGVVFSSVNGGLSRATPDRTSSACIESWRRAAGVRTHEPVTLELCSSLATPSTLLLRTSSGRLLRSVNGGLAWSVLELHGRVLAISSTAAPAVALLECRGRHRLMRSDDGGTNWRVLEADPDLEVVIAEDHVLLAADEDLLAVAATTSGVAIGTDGTGFYRVSGCSGITALTAASVNGRGRVGIALYRELEQCSYVVMVDAVGRHAVRLGEVRAPSAPDYDPDGTPDYAKICGLAWDVTGRLWAAGGFGIMSWAPRAAAVATS